MLLKQEIIWMRIGQIIRYEYLFFKNTQYLHDWWDKWCQPIVKGTDKYKQLS